MLVYFFKIIFTNFIIILTYLNFAVSQDLTRQDPIEKIVYFKGGEFIKIKSKEMLNELVIQDLNK